MTYQIDLLMDPVNANLNAQFRNNIMSNLGYEIVAGLTDNMSMKNLARLREYIDGGFSKE